MNRLFKSQKARWAARKGHKVGVVIVAAVAVVVAFIGTVSFLARAWDWSTASFVHALITFGGIVALLVASRTPWKAPQN